MTEEQGTARERLFDRIATWEMLESSEQRAIADGILASLPLVLEAAQEAGLVSREGLGYTWSSPNHDHGVYQLVACRTDPNRPGS